MKSTWTTEEHDVLFQLCPLYVCDLLDADEKDMFEMHLRAGCALCTHELSLLRSFPEDILAILPEPKEPLREEVRQQLLDNLPARYTSRHRSHPFKFILEKNSKWRSSGYDGIEIKPLNVDASTNVILMLVKIQAGAKYPKHRHTHPEDCFVISGDLVVGGRHLRAGDYHRAESDSIHEMHYSESGCVALIQSSLQDEVYLN